MSRSTDVVDSLSAARFCIRLVGKGEELEKEGEALCNAGRRRLGGLTEVLNPRLRLVIFLPLYSLTGTKSGDA